ncbi:hypothetical protein SAMN05660464_0926 [Geodermatophilus dictyosporus]|uniref:Contractile injection system tube protein N-terminal domain-containing protein n=1 Tax=Geodermatophilus dictyosporus TaxID=1523247 RepID=A0A1I5JQR4_9ACTN|nr:hypothetical protein [Geodermatophilus dictyosporus]SFO74686.1 hypothetical protein SAMN05660464_0926 [Geodermatophilus dictyosporus]
MEFVKARIEEVTTTAGAPPTRVGDPVEVQVNPATLRLQMASTVDFGKDTGRQKIQYQGSTSTLSFDLVFDTADQGTSGAPVDVRTRTRQLERFVLPAMKQAKAVPPRLRFTYGSFSVVGVMTALNQDFDFFAANGVPLRAKCAVTIKEQKPEFDATRAGPGANTGAGATPPVPPGPPGAGVPGRDGRPPGPPPDRTGTALAGESAPDFASRMGLDPRSWKGLQGITDPLRLAAGLQVDFSASLSAGPGPGGPPAGAGDPAPSSGPAEAALPRTVTVDGPALAAAGGLTAVLDRTAAASAGAAAVATRAGFSTGPDPAGRPAPATLTGAGAAAPAHGTADPRSLRYGFGVPLRPRVAVGPSAAPGLVAGSRGTPGAPRLGRDRPAAGRAPETDDPTVPGWRALPLAGRGAPRRTQASCGCWS